MLKNEFLEKYHLSDAVPMDPTAKTVPAEAFSAALEEFIEDRFRGIARVRTDTISAEAILVSAEYAAYFFKMLFTYVYGRVFLNIEIGCDRNGVNMLILADEDIPLTDSEMRFLIKTARNAGMQIYPDGRRIELALPFSKAAILRVYAISVGDGKRVILGKLSEIFYCGSPITVTKVNLDNTPVKASSRINNTPKEESAAPEEETPAPKEAVAIKEMIVPQKERSTPEEKFWWDEE